MASCERGVAQLQLTLGIGPQQSLWRIERSLVAEGDVVDAPLRHVPSCDVHLGIYKESKALQQNMVV